MVVESNSYCIYANDLVDVRPFIWIYSYITVEVGSFPKRLPNVEKGKLSVLPESKHRQKRLKKDEGIR